MSTFDIFRMEPDGILWIEAVSTRDAAKARIQLFVAQSAPCRPLILDQIIGKLVAEEIDEARGLRRSS